MSEDENRYTDLSIDLETLGTDPGSVITQIGLCAFSHNHDVQSSINIWVDPQSCLDVGMKVSWSTIKWWMMQSDAARAQFVAPTVRAIGDALFQANEWIEERLDPDTMKVWGHGSCFDVVLLEDAYRRCNSVAPWSYRNVRDLRTLVALAPPWIEKPKSETEHFAVDDARAQAHWIRECSRTLHSLVVSGLERTREIESTVREIT